MKFKKSEIMMVVWTLIPTIVVILKVGLLWGVLTSLIIYTGFKVMEFFFITYIEAILHTFGISTEEYEQMTKTSEYKKNLEKMITKRLKGSRRK